MRDLLADLDTVLGGERARLPDLAVRLRDLAPAWTPYQRLTGVQLRGQLEDAGVRVVIRDGYQWLDPGDLRGALARREVDGPQ